MHTHVYFSLQKKLRFKLCVNKTDKNWKKSLDNQRFVGAVLIPHILLIAIMHAYGFSIDSPELFFFIERVENKMLG